MPFALILVGLILIIASARGTLKDLGALLKGDFTGANNFFIWLIALGVVGMIGYYRPAEKFSRAFMALILLAMILSNGGFFRKLVDALSQLSDGGSAGSGSAGNTLDGEKAPVILGGSGQTTLGSGAMDDHLGAPFAHFYSAAEAAGIAKAAPAIIKTVTNPLGAAKSVLKSVPILGGFF